MPPALIAWRHRGIIRRFMKEHDVPEARAEALFVETLKWLWLCRRGREAGPTGLRLAIYPELLGIDAMWHCMLLFTRDYGALCDTWFGGFVHHAPNEDESGARPDPQAFAEDLTRYYGFIYDELGEATLRAWFEEKRFATAA